MKPCAAVPDAPVAARRRRPRLAPDLAPYHRRRLVDRRLHGGSLGTLCRFCSRSAKRSCPHRRFSFPTSLAGSVGGPPARQRPSSSPIGRATCERPHRYFPRRVTLKAPCCARALRTNQFICRRIWSRACAALSHRRGATLFMTLLAGFKTLLMARSGRNDVCVATAMANRSQLSTERVIGPLVNTTLIRTRIDADLSFQEALESRARIPSWKPTPGRNSPSISSPLD